MAKKTTTKPSKKAKKTSKSVNGESTATNGKLNLGKVFESKPFAMAMSVAETYAYSKSKIFALLKHAFEKLKDESNRHNVQREFKHKLQIFMRLVKAYYNGTYRKIPTNAVLKVVGGLLYFVWVIDFIPDFIPILGFADDLAVIVWVYNGIKDELEDFERWESVSAINIDN